MALIVDRLGKRFVRLSGDYINWKMKEGTNWNVVNVAILGAWRTAATATSPFGTFYFGLCKGINGVGCAVPESFVGMSAQVRYETSFNNTLMEMSTRRITKIVAGTGTSSADLAVARPWKATEAQDNKLNIIGAQINKTEGTVKTWSSAWAYSNQAAITLAEFKSEMQSSAPPTQLDTTSVASMPTDMDSINIYWSRSDYFLDVYAFDIYRVS